MPSELRIYLALKVDSMVKGIILFVMEHILQNKSHLTNNNKKKKTKTKQKPDVKFADQLKFSVHIHLTSSLELQYMNCNVRWK